MSNKISVINNYLLLTNNNYLTDCCLCGGNVFWEAPSCYNLIHQKSVCENFDICKLHTRKYVGFETQCNGTTNKVCECQLFRINNSNTLINASISNAFWIQYNGSGTQASVEITDTYVKLTDNNGFNETILISNLTISDLQSAIVSLSGGFWNANYISQLGASSASFIAPTTKNYTFSGETQYWNTRSPGIKLRWNNIESNYILYGGSLANFASNIQTELRTIIGVDFTSVENTSLFNRLNLNDGYIELLFGGALCGILQPNIYISLNGLVRSDLSSPTIEIHYGDYESGESYGNTTVYFKNQTNIICPYEDMSGYGPLAFDSNTQCCPQRGCVVGPNQFVDPSISGYWRSDCTSDNHCNYCEPLGIGTCWRNLERTFTVASGSNQLCYNLSPFYFLFGKQGRFVDDPYFYQKLFITPDCDYSQSSGNCNQQQLPCNCTPQLFMPYLHPDVPWGPFGSYYEGIENDIHKAYLTPYSDPLFPSGQSYLSANLMGGYQNERIGFDYRPWGWMKVRGTWQDTKEIEIRVVVHRPQPFYVGPSVFDDLDFYIEIDSSTVTNPNLTYTPTDPNGGCGATTFLFNCSGQTVGDFVEAMNNVKIKDFNCNLFAFCKSSDAAMNIPASRIMNISSELYEQRVAGGTGCSPLCPSAYDINGPEIDDERWSGCDLIPQPRRYQDTFSLHPENPGLSQYYDPPITSSPSESYLRKSPQCRLYVNKLPKYDDSTSPYISGFGTDTIRSHIAGTYLTNCWVTSMVGCNQNVLVVSKATGIDPFSILTVQSSGRQIIVFGSGFVNGTGFISSGYINTNKNGSGYTVRDCINEINAFKFKRFDNLLSLYNPIVANSGLNIDIWLDDSTSMSGNILATQSSWNFLYGPEGNIPTQYNFSYVEPLLDSSVQSIIENNSIATFQSWIRNRCGSSGIQYFGDDLGGTVSTVNSDMPAYCVPPDTNNTINANLDCNGDKVISNSWLISYGCNSYVCRTEWYIPSVRCSCSTVYRCTGPNQGREFAHPFNQSTQGSNNEIWNDYGSEVSVTQPLIYICDLNFHPECDIPMMVKVPFQIHNLTGPGSVHWQYGQNLSLPGIQEFCVDFPDGNPWYSNAYGWCQTIDPLGPKVKKSEIPRTTPSTAYVAERGIGVFCSNNPWNYDPRYIALDGVPTIFVGGLLYQLMPGCLTCNDPNVQGCNTANCNNYNGWACANCDNWDRIENIGVMLETGLFYTNDPTPMKALFRPVLKNLSYDDVCPSGAFSCDRFDIDCGTACCECVFTCDNGCFDQIHRNPWTYTEAYSRSRTESGIGMVCNFSFNTFPCDYRVGVCNGSPVFVWVGPCYNGSMSISINGTASRTTTTCGCVGNGSETTSYSCSQTCSSSLGCLSWINNTCPPNETLIFDCSFFPSARTSNICCNSGSTGCLPGCMILTRNDGSNCPAGGIATNNYDSYIDQCSTISNDNCGQQSDIVWSDDSVTKAAGTSSCDGVTLGDTGSCNNTWTNTISENGSYHRTVITYSTCPDTNPISSKTYDEVINWPYRISGWVCYSANLMVSIGGSGDSRWKGNRCV